jgi:hypothetical protein
MFHIQAEFECLHRPFLADDFIQGVDLRGVFKFENSGVTDTSEVGGF